MPGTTTTRYDYSWSEYIDNLYHLIDVIFHKINLNYQRDDISKYDYAVISSAIGICRSYKIRKQEIL